MTLPVLLLAALATAPGGCRAARREQPMVVTAYCACGECNGYTRGHWWLLHLDFWNRRVAAGPKKGHPYTGRTASGGRLREAHPGLLSIDSVVRPYMIPVRLAFFPWLFLPSDGTLAADTAYYPFGTRIYVPGYGWGVVRDRGSAIQGPEKLDIFVNGHGRANHWGRQRLIVEVEE